MLVVLVQACGGGTHAVEPAKLQPVAAAPSASAVASESPESSLASGGSVASASASEAVPVCPETCRGAVTADLMRALQSQLIEARACYEDALRRDPRLLGKVRLLLELSERGETCRVSVDQSEIDDREMMSCLLTVAKTQYPPPAGGCAHVMAPLQFRPKPAEQAADATP